MRLSLAPPILVYIFVCFGSGLVFGQISAVVQTDQMSYVLGEPIELTVRAINNSPDDILLTFPSSIQAQYTLDDSIFRTPCCGATVITYATVPGNGTFDWDFLLNSNSLSIGTHSVTGHIAWGPGSHGGLTTLPSFFDITEPPEVVDDVFIDFESYPDGSPTRGPGSVGFVENSYQAWGIEFRAIGSPGAVVNLSDNFSDDTILHTPTSNTTIEATFDLPIYGVTADVGSAQGRSVEMKLFDSDGNVLGTVESDVVDNYPDLEGPVSFASAVPIASVQWSSSDPLAVVRIDNLLLDVEFDTTLMTDFDQDDDVDGTDFLAWQQGRSPNPMSASDYQAWKSAYAGSAAATGLKAIPEPNAMVLVCGSLLLSCAGRITRRKQMSTTAR